MNHHAYLLRTEQPHKSAVVSIIATLAVPEIYYLEFTTFGILDAKILIKKAYQKPVQGSEQLLVVLTTSITVEAEQALLKLFEEPPQGTRIVLCLPPHVTLLPTLLSRFSTLQNIESHTSDPDFLTEFIALPLGEQFEKIAKHLKNDDTHWVATMHKALVHYLHTNTHLPHTDRLTVHQALSKINTRGASNKMLLEEIMLSLKRGSQ